MKKGLKIGVVAMAMFATVATLALTGNVKAENDTTNQVTVVIGKYNSGQNNCTLGNFYYEFAAATTEDSQETGNVAECIFGNQNGTPVTLQLSGDLISTTGGTTNVISGENVKLKNSLWTMVPDGIGSNTAIESYRAFNTLETVAELFTKNSNVVGDASGTVMIEVTVPAGTPEGTYNGELVFSYGG